MTTQKQNRLILIFQAIFFPVFTAMIIAVFNWQVKIYKVLTLQPSIDQAQNVRINQAQLSITSLVNLSGEAQKTNNEQDKQIIKIQAILPKKGYYYFKNIP